MARKSRVKQVALGVLGTALDQGTGAARWKKWRPTVALCQQEDLLIDRLDLLHASKHAALAALIAEDVRRVSPETEVRAQAFELVDPWDFEEVYGALHDFAKRYPWRPEEESYLAHITTGTHVVQICLFLLAESRHIPARLVQTSPPRGLERGGPGSYTIVDLDLSKYDRLASRFRTEQREGLSFLKAGIDTKNAEFNRLIERIERVALKSKGPILLTGPTGAGKSQLAKRIHALKRERQLAARLRSRGLERLSAHRGDEP